MQTREIELPPLSLRAALTSFNPDARTVDVVWSSGAGVQRRDLRTGETYLEFLSMNPAHVRLARLNAGAPLLDSHTTFSISDQIGGVVPESARIVDGRGIATVRFSARAAVNDIVQDVADGILRGVSVGYRVARYEESKVNKALIRTATDWTPFELSLVSMPADLGAKIRHHEGDCNRCVVVAEPRLRYTDEERNGLFQIYEARAVIERWPEIR